MSDGIDYSTQYGAKLLADRIKAYWRERGVTVKCEVFITPHQRTSDHYRYYGIRSDIGMYEPQGAQ